MFVEVVSSLTLDTQADGIEELKDEKTKMMIVIGATGDEQIKGERDKRARCNLPLTIYPLPHYGCTMRTPPPFFDSFPLS